MPAKKQRKVTLGGLLGGKLKKEPEKEKAADRDELEQYLWRTRSAGYRRGHSQVVAHQGAQVATHLAKMVKQYFAAPASSAGVERVFSAAGKMDTDLKKSAKDTTLGHSLFAAFYAD